MLLTQELRTHLRRNADLSAIAEKDHRPVVKLFTPDAQATWLFTDSLQTATPCSGYAMSATALLKSAMPA